MRPARKQKTGSSVRPWSNVEQALHPRWFETQAGDFTGELVMRGYNRRDERIMEQVESIVRSGAT